MIKNKRCFLALGAVFVATEAFLAVFLQCTSGASVRISSYLSVVLACLFCVTFANRTASYFFTQAALLCTVGADYFLVLIEERQQLPAMIFFLFAQTFYFLRLYFEDNDKVRRIVHFAVRGGSALAVLLLTTVVLGEKADAVALVSMVYYVFLILNTVFSFLQNGARSLFSWGLVLFVLCDTVVGLSCIGPYLTIPADSVIHVLLNPGFNLAWVFYLPSQVCLALSLIAKDTQGKNNTCRSCRNML